MCVFECMTMNGEVEEANLFELARCLHTYLDKDSAMCVIYYLIVNGQMYYPSGGGFRGRIRTSSDSFRHLDLPWYNKSEVVERPRRIFPTMYFWRKLYASRVWNTNLAGELNVLSWWNE